MNSFLNMIDRVKERIITTLRWSEGWTKTDMVYVASSFSWVTVGNIFSSVASFLFIIAFANLLPPETFGVYKYVLSIVSILSITTLTGMSNAVTRSIAQGYEAVVPEVVWVKIRWGLTGSFAGLLMSGYYYLNGNTLLTLSFLMTAILLPFMDTFAVYDSLLRGRKLFREVSIYGTIKQFISVGLMVCVLFFSNNIFLILLSYFSVRILVDMVFLRLISFNLQLNRKKSPDVISYGKHLSFMSIIGTIADQVDKIILWHLLGPISLAVYSFSLSPVLRLRSFVTPLAAIALPKMSKVTEITVATKKSLFIKMLKLLVLLLPVTVAYVVLAPHFYDLFFPDYVESVVYSQFFVLSLLLVPFSLATMFLTSQAKKKSLYLISIINPSIKIILIVTLLPLFGVWGAIVALLLSKLSSSLVSLFFFSRA